MQFLALCFLFISSLCFAHKALPDRVFSGRVWTATPLKTPEGVRSGAARCLVVSYGEITYIGEKESDCLELVDLTGSEGSREVDIVRVGPGEVVTPGLVDPHVHLVPAGASLRRVDLRSCRSLDELLERVASASAAASPGAWILGFGWDENAIHSRAPSRQELDAAASGRPVWLWRVCSHAGVASTAALAAGGVDPDAPCSPSAAHLVACGPDGTPSGLLLESAMLSVAAAAQEGESAMEALRAAQQAALGVGVTAVGDMGEPAWSRGPWQAWRDLEVAMMPTDEAGGLALRVQAFVPLSIRDDVADTLSRGTRCALGESRIAGDKEGSADASRLRGQCGGGGGGGRLSWGGLKEFADGSLGTRTAFFWGPYEGVGGVERGEGVATVDFAWLGQEARKCLDLGLPLAVHAIGDRAVDEVLTAMETALGDDGVAPPGLLRIEHVQHVSGPGVGARLAKSGIHAVVNPQHMEMDVPVLEERLGSGRAGPDRAFPLRMLLDSGARVSAGSDWPVVPLDPLASMLAAVHGPPSAPPGPRFGGATAQEAFLMHTAWAAEAAGLGDVGRLEVGRAADLVVWTRDIVEWLRCAGERGDGCGERPGVGAVYVRGECMVGCEGAVARR